MCEADDAVGCPVPDIVRSKYEGGEGGFSDSLLFFSFLIIIFILPPLFPSNFIIIITTTHHRPLPTPTSP